MDNAEHVKAFLSRNPGQFYCNPCLSEELDIPNPAQLNQITRPLRGVPPYRNGKVICRRCGNERECISFR